LRDLYPHQKTVDVAAAVGKTVSQAYQKATALDLKKSPEYLSSPADCRLRRGDNIAAAFRFKPRQVVWNKCTNFTAGGRSPEMRFKPGAKPRNHKPVWTTRIVVDGTLEVKVAEGMRQWKAVHRLEWKCTTGNTERQQHCFQGWQQTEHPYRQSGVSGAQRVNAKKYRS
jgi:hypothetical protein